MSLIVILFPIPKKLKKKHMFKNVFVVIVIFCYAGIIASDSLAIDPAISQQSLERLNQENRKLAEKISFLKKYTYRLQDYMLWMNGPQWPQKSVSDLENHMNYLTTRIFRSQPGYTIQSECCWSTTTGIPTAYNTWFSHKKDPSDSTYKSIYKLTESIQEKVVFSNTLFDINETIFKKRHDTLTKMYPIAATRNSSLELEYKNLLDSTTYSNLFRLWLSPSKAHEQLAQTQALLQKNKSVCLNAQKTLLECRYDALLLQHEANKRYQRDIEKFLKHKAPNENHNKLDTELLWLQSYISLRGPEMLHANVNNQDPVDHLMQKYHDGNPPLDPLLPRKGEEYRIEEYCLKSFYTVLLKMDSLREHGIKELDQPLYNNDGQKIMSEGDFYSRQNKSQRLEKNCRELLHERQTIMRQIPWYVGGAATTASLAALIGFKLYNRT